MRIPLIPSLCCTAVVATWTPASAAPAQPAKSPVAVQAAAGQPGQFPLTLALDSRLAQALAQRGKTVTVQVTWFGRPARGYKGEYLTEMLGQSETTKTMDVPARSAAITAPAYPTDFARAVDGPMTVRVFVFSEGSGVQMKCPMPEATLAKAREQGISIRCTL